ncbi:hypothetical protein E8E11_009144 [Didymella keratinophila]|nr:hypothetical protein E8E11_009144 [Didymella keratinophila]
MGNCGSSLNCDQCFDSESSPGCLNEIKANSDIAGYGILISFYFSARLLTIAFVWGWCKKSLPSGILAPTDYHIVQLVRNRGKAFNDTDVQLKQILA